MSRFAIVQPAPVEAAPTLAPQMRPDARLRVDEIAAKARDAQRCTSGSFTTDKGREHALAALEQLRRDLPLAIAAVRG